MEGRFYLKFLKNGKCLELVTFQVAYSHVLCRSALSKSKLPELDYSLNPYVGCEHGCLYCYSRSLLKNEDLIPKWGKFVWVKKNLVDRLRVEVRRRKKGVVGVGTVTDPYQPIEAKLKLTQNCLKLLTAYHFPVSIQTKSSLILRDLDFIKPQSFDVGVTLTTINEDLAEKLEPKASKPTARIQVLEELKNRGVETWIFLGPIIPSINDDEKNIEEIVEVARKNKCKILYDKLNLKKGVLESLQPFLEKENPKIVNFLPKILSPWSTYWKEKSKMILRLCKEKNVECKPAFPYV